MVYYALGKAFDEDGLVVYLSDQKNQLNYDFHPSDALAIGLDKLSIFELQEGIFESVRLNTEKDLTEALESLGCENSPALAN